MNTPTQKRERIAAKSMFDLHTTNTQIKDLKKLSIQAKC